MRNLTNWKFIQFLMNFISDKNAAKHLKFCNSILSPVVSYQTCLFHAYKKTFFYDFKLWEHYRTLSGKRLNNLLNFIIKLKVLLLCF